jgi:hypothetical protein
MSWTALVIPAVITVAAAMVVAPALAGAPLMMKAKQQGYPARDCQYCHVSKMPVKDGFKRDDLNQRGKWLAAEKDKKQAKEIDLAWLKDYPGDKDQK